MDYLNEAEKSKLVAFNSDEVMREAVRKVLLEPLYEVGVLTPGKPSMDRNWAYRLSGNNDAVYTDEQLGALLRATCKGLAFLEDGFKRLSEFKLPIPVAEDDNPAV